MSEKYISVKIVQDDSKEQFIPLQQFEAKLLQTEAIKSKKKSRRFLGIFLALLASIIGPFTAIIVKGLPNYHPVTLAAWRFIGLLLPSIAMVIFHKNCKHDDIFALFKETGRGRIFILLVVRGIIGTIALLCMFYALQYLTVGDCKVITNSQPFFVLLLAHFTLGEKCGVIPFVAGLAAIAGIVVIARPPLITGEAEFDTEVLKGTLFASVVLLCATGIHVLLRSLRTVHYTLVTLSFATIGTLVTVSWAFAIDKWELPASPVDWGMAVGMSVVSMVTQNLQNLAFKYEDASVTSLVRSSSVVFSFVWEWIFFLVVPDKFSTIGASIVILAIFVVGLRKYVKSSKPEDKIRTQCWCILF